MLYSAKAARVMLALAVAWLLTCPPGTVRAEEALPSAPIKIGVVNSLFRDTPPALINILSRPLKALMSQLTGVSGDLVLAGDALSVAKQLKENKAQLGVFHGYEFAWARQHYPELKPLVVAVAHHPNPCCVLVVHKDNAAASCGDLKGQSIAMPSMSRGHIHLYLERRCPGAGSDPKKFFSQVRRISDPEEALDEVVDGELGGALVDKFSLERFQQNKVDRSQRLRVLHESEAFPASVIAYYPGTLDESLLKRFREGLLGAAKDPKSRDLLRMCRMTSFEEIPADYEQLLLDIIKSYPAPLPAKEGK